MTMPSAASPKTKQQDRQTVENFQNWKFPDLKKLEDLQSLQREEREYLESIERNGATGRPVEFLQSRVELREMEIEDIRANGRFP
jgi:hypothetical protein